jgi:hypothetical protein
VWNAPPAAFGTVSDDILAGLVADGDRAWAARSDARQLDEAARSWTAALRLRPDDHGLLVKLGRLALRRGAHGGDAVAFDAAAGWAERALSARNGALAAAARAKAQPGDVFARAEPPDAPALALYAEALLDWSIAKGTPTVMTTRPWIEAAAQRALALDRTVAWSGPDRVLGTLDCALPVAGQNLRDAYERFEAAVATAPAYLPNRLAYAESYAVRVRDAALWHHILDELIAADPHALPDTETENREAQADANALLARAR